MKLQVSITLYEKRINEIENNYKRINEIYNNNSKNLHDISHHMMIIKTLAEDADNQRLLEYIEGLGITGTNIINYTYTGIDIIDTIINSIKRKASDKGINITIEADILPTPNKILDNDYCSLFANLLENAVESSNSYIKLSIRMVNQMLLISEENDYNILPRTKDGLLLSTKPNPQNHGLGNRIILSICKKYGGNATFHFSDHVFTSDLILSL